MKRLAILLYLLRAWIVDGLAAASVVVFGSTGRLGREIVKSLGEKPDVSVVCVAKDMAKARSIFGADKPGFSVVPCDIVRDRPAKIAALVRGADSVVNLDITFSPLP